MSDRAKLSVVLTRLIAAFLAAGVFVADFGFDAFAKAVPWYAYALIVLLALGVEANALGRLLVDMVRGAAKLPPDDGSKGDDP